MEATMSDRYDQNQNERDASSFFVPATKVPAMKEALLALRGTFRNFDEVRNASWYKDYGISEPDIIDMEFGLEIVYDGEGNAIKLKMLGERSQFLGYCDPYLRAIAPFVQEGSIMYFHQESGMEAHFVFKGGSFSMEVDELGEDDEEGEE